MIYCLMGTQLVSCELLKMISNVDTVPCVRMIRCEDGRVTWAVLGTPPMLLMSTLICVRLVQTGRKSTSWCGIELQSIRYWMKLHPTFVLCSIAGIEDRLSCFPLVVELQVRGNEWTAQPARD